MRIVRWNWNFIGKARAKPLNGAHRRHIIRVARKGHPAIKCTDERSDGTARLKRVAMATKWLKNLKSDVPRANPDMLRITDTEIDVARIGAIRKQNAEMIGRNKASGPVARHNSDKTQSDLPGR